MAELRIACGVLVLGWFAAIQGDRNQLGLPVWDGTFKSLITVPPTPTHPSHAQYSAPERGFAYTPTPSSSYASPFDSSSATSASSSSRFGQFDWAEAILLLWFLMLLLIALCKSLSLAHQYYLGVEIEEYHKAFFEEMLEFHTRIWHLKNEKSSMQNDFDRRSSGQSNQRTEWSEEKRTLCATIARLEDKYLEMQDDLNHRLSAGITQRTQWDEEKRTLQDKIAHLEERNAAIQDESRIKWTNQEQTLRAAIANLEKQNSTLQDKLHRRVPEEAKSGTDQAPPAPSSNNGDATADEHELEGKPTGPKSGASDSISLSKIATPSTTPPFHPLPSKPPPPTWATPKAETAANAALQDKSQDGIPLPPATKPVHGLPARPPMAADIRFGFAGTKPPPAAPSTNPAISDDANANAEDTERDDKANDANSGGEAEAKGKCGDDGEEKEGQGGDEGKEKEGQGSGKPSEDDGSVGGEGEEEQKKKKRRRKKRTGRAREMTPEEWDARVAGEEPAPEIRM